MKISINEKDRIQLEPENIREAYKIGRLSKQIGNTTTLIGDEIKIEFSYHEILELARQLEEKV